MSQGKLGLKIIDSEGDSALFFFLILVIFFIFLFFGCVGSLLLRVGFL